MAYKELKLGKGEAAGLYDILGASPNPKKKTTTKKPAAKKSVSKKKCK